MTDAGRTQVPLGFVADRVGGPRVMLASLVAWSAVAAATPLVGAAPAGSVFPLLVGARAALGLAQSCLMPATSAMAAQYAPGAAAAAFQTPLNGRAGPSRSPASCPPPPPWPPIARPGPPRPRPSLRSFAALGLVPPSCPVLAAHRHAYVRSTTSVVLGGCPGRGPAPRSARAHALRGAARWVQPGARARALAAIYAAASAGTVAGMLLTPLLQWPAALHAFSAAGLAWAVRHLSGSALPALGAGTHARTAASLFCRKAGAGGAPLARCLRCHVPGARRPRSKRLHDAPVHPCRLGCGGKVMLPVLQGAWATVGSHIGLAAGARCVPCELRCARARCGQQALCGSKALGAPRVFATSCRLTRIWPADAPCCHH